MHREHPIFKTIKPTKPSKYSKGNWCLLECLETGLVYLDNPVEYESLESDFAWEKTYIKEKEERRKREPLFSMLSDFTKKIRRKLRKLPKIQTLPVDLSVSHFSEEGRLNLLDIGCGSGQYGISISNRIKHRTEKIIVPYGIEISTELQKSAHEKFSTLGGAVIHASAIDGVKQLDDLSQHMVIMHSFLEHETNPLDLLLSCKDKMFDHGLLIIKVPNYSCWNRKIRQNRWCGFRYPDHVNYFSPNNLKLLLREAGYGVYRMNFFDQFPTSDNMWVIAEKSNKSPHPGLDLP